MQNRQPGQTPQRQAMRQPLQQQTAQRQMGPRQMSRPSGRPQQMNRGAAQNGNGNRPKGILGNLLNMQDPIGSLNKIVSIFLSLIHI